MITARDIEKLKAIGFHISGPEFNGVSDDFFVEGQLLPGRNSIHKTADDAWNACKAHVQGDGLAATMAAKARFLESYEMLCRDGDEWLCCQGAEEFHVWSDSPEAAVDLRFWEVA